ncbi:hypothetical protein AB0N14_13685 [Streptomyces sp. NPDC051104]|uniref:hypothetical protein n=1 Tax=Streptomyces sp. NPDC051104 TaxID=3155044 RepID=UPI003444585A
MDPIQRALAELRAIPTTKPTSQPEPEPTTPSCCSGDRRGYQWHQRTGNLPACKESKAANTAYMRPYMRDYDNRTGRTGGKRRRGAAAKLVFPTP